MSGSEARQNPGSPVKCSPPPPPALTASVKLPGVYVSRLRSLGIDLDSARGSRPLSWATTGVSVMQAAFLFSSVGSHCKATWGPEEIAPHLTLARSLLSWPGSFMPLQFVDVNSLYHAVLLPPSCNLQTPSKHLSCLPTMTGR